MSAHFCEHFPSRLFFTAQPHSACVVLQWEEEEVDGFQFPDLAFNLATYQNNNNNNTIKGMHLPRRAYTYVRMTFQPWRPFPSYQVLLSTSKERCKEEPYTNKLQKCITLMNSCSVFCVVVVSYMVFFLHLLWDSKSSYKSKAATLSREHRESFPRVQTWLTSA